MSKRMEASERVLRASGKGRVKSVSKEDISWGMRVVRRRERFERVKRRRID